MKDDLVTDRPARPPAGPPPKYKMAVVMLVSVYPTITLLIWLLWPVVAAYPLPVRTLVVTLVMVPLMTWLIVPWVTGRFSGWLTAGAGMTTAGARDERP